MAMRAETEFVARLSALFGEPTSVDSGATMTEYENAFRGQSTATLQAAADHLARTHKIRCWPTVAECFDAVAAVKRRGRTAAVGLTEIEDFDGWWAERIARVRVASDDAQIRREIDQVEPYASSGWILRSRLPEIMDHADKRRRQWRENAATSQANRMIGDRS